ncbi:MAG: hypothetical protein AAGH76_01205 [Pseudomonadota bacterium]
MAHIRAVLTILVLMAVLQPFGLTDVLSPLSDMGGTNPHALTAIGGALASGHPSTPQGSPRATLFLV